MFLKRLKNLLKKEIFEYSNSYLLPSSLPYLILSLKAIFIEEIENFTCLKNQII
jgi:hypothetical protein